METVYDYKLQDFIQKIVNPTLNEINENTAQKIQNGNTKGYSRTDLIGDIAGKIRLKEKNLYIRSTSSWIELFVEKDDEAYKVAIYKLNATRQTVTNKDGRGTYFFFAKDLELVHSLPPKFQGKTLGEMVQMLEEYREEKRLKELELVLIADELEKTLREAGYTIEQVKEIEKNYNGGAVMLEEKTMKVINAFMEMVPYVSAGAIGAVLAILYLGLVSVNNPKIYSQEDVNQILRDYCGEKMSNNKKAIKLKCIETFEVDRCGTDSDIAVFGETMEIEKGSLWEQEDREIAYLDEDCDGPSRWLDLSKYELHSNTSVTGTFIGSTFSGKQYEGEFEYPYMFKEPSLSKIINKIKKNTGLSHIVIQELQYGVVRGE